jgi:hypothetical protein
MYPYTFVSVILFLNILSLAVGQGYYEMKFLSISNLQSEQTSMRYMIGKIAAEETQERVMIRRDLETRIQKVNDTLSRLIDNMEDKINRQDL